MEKAEAQKLVDSHPNWYHRFEIFPGIITPGAYDPSNVLATMKLPESMAGARVLDIGTCDGYFAKVLAARGADVTAIDYAPRGHFGFHIMEQLQDQKFTWICENLYDLGKHDFEPFDYVVCLGVLYHLPDMMRALWILRNLVKGVLFLETHVSRKYETEPVAEYLPGSTLNNDYTNFWAPNSLCVQSMLQDAAFRVEESTVAGPRALFRCVVNNAATAAKKIRVAYSKLEP